MSVEINSNIKELEDKLQSKVDDLTESTAEKIKQEARSNAPVDTGRLKNSIKIEKSDKTGWSVVSEAPYSVYVEFGTRYQEAQRFLRDAIMKGEQHFSNEARNL